MSASTPPLARLLYVSALAPGASISDVARIALIARRRNADDGITGLLVFDGSAFAQFVEGDPPAIAALLARLRADRRHVDLDVLVHDRGAAARRHPGWDLGYHFAADERDDLDALRGLRGAAALAAFEAKVARVDLGADQAVPG